jgi:hypothetical protein
MTSLGPGLLDTPSDGGMSIAGPPAAYRGQPAAGCYRCQLGDPHTVHETATAAHGSPPPSTVEEMRGVLTSLDAERPRSRQTALGPSELGTPCQRQIAYKLAGVPRQLPDARPPWAPMQGTAMHVLMADALEHHNRQLGRQRWLVEHRVQVDHEISGSFDAYDHDCDMMVDWKYVGTTSRRKASRVRVPHDQLLTPDYRVQAHLYGYGHQRAGRPVKWVRIVLLARSHNYDDSREWTEAYDPRIAIHALDRYYATQDLIRDLALAANPALWAAVPAHVSQETCDWCEFRRRGGPADGTGCPGNNDIRAAYQTRGLIA